MMSASTTCTTTLLPVALRDTALSVASLACDPAPPSFATFREKCKQQVARLREEMKSAGHPHDVVQDAVYAQCAILDESALSNLRGGDRDAWAREPLQVDEFQSHDAGDELILRIERRLAQPSVPCWISGSRASSRWPVEMTVLRSYERSASASAAIRIRRAR
jgi:type VI secretion system protein ImpK